MFKPAPKKQNVISISKFPEPPQLDEPNFKFDASNFHLNTPVVQRISQLNENSPDSQKIQSIFDIPTSENNEPFSSYFDQFVSEERDAFVFSIHEEGPRLFLYCKYLADSSHFGTVCICISNPIFCVEIHPKSSSGDDKVEKEIEEIAEKCGGKVINGIWKEKMDFERTFKRIYEVNLSSTTDMTKIPIHGKTYNKLTGATYSLSDVFCFKRGVKGNCWIRAHCSQAQHLSTTIPMYTAQTIEDISLISEYREEKCAFNICVLSLNLTEDQKIEIATLRIFTQWDLANWCPFEGMRKSSTRVFTFAVTEDLNLLSSSNSSTLPIKYCETEALLLKTIMDIIEEVDTDIIVSYNLFSSDLPILIKRMQTLKIPNWFFLGRHTRGVYTSNIKVATAGRVICDLKASYLSLFGIESSNFSDLCSRELPEFDRPIINLPIYEHISKNFVLLRNLIAVSQKDTKFIAQMLKNRSLLNVAKIVSRFCGSLWSNVMCSSENSKFFENFLIFSLLKKNYFIPDRLTLPIDSPDCASIIQFPSILGVHEATTFFEASALIPLIIRQFSICFIQGKGPKILPPIVAEITGRIQKLNQSLETVQNPNPPISSDDQNQINQNQNIQLIRKGSKIENLLIQIRNQK